ncbi:MAG: arylesterase [Cyclobacteriaceae bacterium]|nr:arylesterase [Cyclobacteriaceae bacterium SS2]
MKSTLLILIFFGILARCSQTTRKDDLKSDTPEATKEINQKSPDKIIMFFGNSITAGYGVSTEEAFPARIQVIVDSLDYPYKVVNAGLSGETSAGGLNRIDWVLRTIPDVFVLELGGNDGLRGLKLSETKKNLSAIIKKVEDVNPDVSIILAGMEVPPNLGQDYTQEFRNLYKELAQSHNVVFIPFILEGVGGEEDLNQSDGIHPNVEGHQIVAQTVWGYLSPLLTKNTSGEGI